MKSEGFGKAVIITFLLALAIYVVGFTFIQHKRENKGPWVIEFRTDAGGTPKLIISQEALSISNQTIGFPEIKLPETNFSKTIHFDGPTTNVPFGEVAFQDPTFLPGSVAFNFWGHGVELLPRRMIINKEGILWNTRTNIELTGEGKFERREVRKRFP